MAAGPEAVVRGHWRAAALMIPAGCRYHGGKRIEVNDGGAKPDQPDFLGMIADKQV